VQNFIKIGKPLLRYSNLSFTSRWQLSAILDLWRKFWDDQQRVFGDLYHYKKIGWNFYRRFHNTKF